MAQNTQNDKLLKSKLGETNRNDGKSDRILT